VDSFGESTPLSGVALKRVGVRIVALRSDSRSEDVNDMETADDAPGNLSGVRWYRAWSEI